MKLRIDQITAIQTVRRWHTRGTYREQSVAEHSHQVALLALHLAPTSLCDFDLLQLLLLALLHDAHEGEFGDFPYPTKVMLKELGMDVDDICQFEFWGSIDGADPFEEALPHVRRLVDVADLLEAALYAQKWIPELAEKTAQQAIQAAHRLSPQVFVKVVQALGRVPFTPLED